MARIGIEEEFVLLDEDTLVPLAMSADTVARITAPRSIGQVMPEFLTCQLECATGPVDTRADAAAQLHDLRAAVGAHAAPLHAVVASTGTPLATTRSLAVSSSAHYDAVAEQLAHITRGHVVNGLHVHVEVPDAEERVRALNRVRGWLPALLALSGNSPFAEGLPSGFASWRSILIRRLPASWTPPHFHDLDDYRAQVEQLIAVGAITEPSSLSWGVRISERFPTVEVRICDAQLDVDDTLLLAALVRAAVLGDGLGVAAGVDSRSAGASTVDAIDASLWTAARRGMDARLLDPTTGRVADAWAVVTRLLDVARPVLQEHGDAEFVADRLARIRVDGTGAQRQERAYAQHGLPGLSALYRRSTDAAAAAAAPATDAPA